MSWWDRLRGHQSEPSQPPAPAQTTTLLASQAIIPEQLSASVYLHDFMIAPGNSIPCWTYVSAGMLAHGQKEIIFTLRIEKGEQPTLAPHEPLALFRTIYHLAAQGQIVDAGGFTQLGAAAFLGGHLIYIEPQPIAGVDMPAQAITALLVTQDEVVAAQEFGVTRLMAQLGRRSKYYPCPPWSERTRRGPSLSSMRQSSLLAKVARTHMREVHVSRQNACICVQIRPAAAAHIRRLAELSEGRSVALLTALDPQANACLTWEPGQRGPQAISPPQSDGSRASGCFLAIIAQQKEDSGQIFEDGFALLLTDASWQALFEALHQGKGFGITTTAGSLSARFEWAEEAAPGPARSAPPAAGGGQIARPADPPRPRAASASVQLAKTVLESSRQAIMADVSIEALDGFVRGIEAQLQQACALAPAPFELRVQCTLHPAARPTVQLAAQPQADRALLQLISDALSAVAPIQTRQRPIGFQLIFAIEPVSNG